jgi:hypothetical protein
MLCNLPSYAIIKSKGSPAAAAAAAAGGEKKVK